MSLIKCKECGHQISKSALQCPSCGSKFKRTSAFTMFIALFIGLGVVASIVGSLFDNPSPTSDSAQSAVQATAKLTTEQQAAATKENAQSNAPKNAEGAVALGTKWQYNESKEPMGQGTIKLASVDSINEIQFDFPYQGRQRGTLLIQSHPRHGKAVALQVQRGQFLCGVRGCSVSVKFDDGKVVTFSGSEPSDHSSMTLFITGHDRFVSEVKKGKRLAIEAEFFQEGSKVFEFDVEGLNW